MSRLTIVALLLAAACGGKSTPPPTTPLPEDKPTEPVAKPEEPKPADPPKIEPLEVSIPTAAVAVKLTKAGTGKKSKLIYTIPKAETKTPVELAFDFVQKADSPQEGKVEVISPTIVLLTEASLSAADETHLGFTYNLTGIDARDVPNQKMDAKSIKDQIGSMTGLTIKGKVGTDGIASENTAVRIEKGDDAGKQIVSLVQTALPTWPTLPTEPIGAGAKWTATTTASLMGQLEVTQVTEYELVSRKGAVTVIKGKITMTGADIDKGGAKISGIKGTGTTEATLTDGTLPAFKTAVETAFTITDPKNQSATVGVKVGAAVTPKAVAAATPAPDAKK